MRRVSTQLLAGASALAIIGLGIPATPTLAGGGGGKPKPPKVTTIATGLLNPRGVSVAWDGSVYVAESGAGGGTEAMALVEGEESAVCLGDTGGVTRVRSGHQERIATVASMTAAVADPNDPNAAPGCDPSLIGDSAVGPSDVVAELDGSVTFTMGLGGTGDVRDGLPPEFGDSFGKLFNVNRRGNVRELADLTAFEDASNPDGTEIDSNPYGVTTYLGGHLATDAGGNSVVRIDWRGNVSALTAFDQVPVVPYQLDCAPVTLPGPPFTDPVPTSVAVGLDGYAYVGLLTGFPFMPGAASVYRVNLRTGEKSVFADGFTNIVGVATALDGSVYVVEIAEHGLINAAPAPNGCGEPQGRLVKVARNGTQTVIDVPGLVMPGGVAVGLDGTVYVSNYSVQPGGAGELLAIRT